MSSKTRKGENAKTLSDMALSQSRVKTILRTVPYEEAFHFYEDLDKPTGQLANSLIDLRDKIKGAKSDQARTSLLFHLKRGDFSNWIKDIVRDSVLAEHIREIDPDRPASGRKLRLAVETRVNQLRDMLQRHTVIPEDDIVSLSLKATHSR